MIKNKSEHILNTSANLLGFCLVIMTSFHFTDRGTATLVDEGSAFISILLAFSCFFSFGAIRSTNIGRSNTFETIADYFFIFSLIGILIITILLSVSII